MGREGFSKYLQDLQADNRHFDTYCENVKRQAVAMNTHNSIRVKLEKDGEEYRTYIIMKHLMLCAGGKVHHSKITAGDLLAFRNDQKIKVAGILVEGVLQPAEIKEILVNGDQLYKKF